MSNCEEVGTVCILVCNYKLSLKAAISFISFATADYIMMFAAANPLGMGGPSVVSDTAEFFIFANHNLVAGQRAM